MNYSSISVGERVPDFTMEGYDPAEKDFVDIRLADIRKAKKWTVLVFYPADFTFVCPTELADLAERHPELKKLGVEVISVSTDTKFAHLSWRREETLLRNVEFIMAADPTGNVSRIFGVYEEQTGLAFRGTFIISPEGILVGSEINLANVGRDADELLRKMKANVYLAKHPNEVCPAKWTTGEKTLKPSAQLVGKVGEVLGKA